MTNGTELLIYGLISASLGFISGYLTGRRNPSKDILKIEYYQGRVDQIKDNPDKWEK